MAERRMDIRENLGIIAGLLITSLVSGYSIAQNYQHGLILVFWLCIMTGIVAFLWKNVLKLESLFFLFLFVTPLMNIVPGSYKYILPLGSMFLIGLMLAFFHRTIVVDNLIRTANGRLLVAYLIINVMLFPYSVDKVASLTYLVSFPLIILLWDWIIQAFDREDRVIRVFKVINGIGVFYSILGLVILAMTIIGLSMGDYVYYERINRFFYYVSSVFPNTNTHGMLLAFTIPCTFYLLLERKEKLFYLCSFLIVGLNLFLSFSRSSWVAAAVSVAIIFIFKYKDKYKFLLPLTWAGVILVVLLLPLVAHLQVGFGKFSEGLLSLNGRGLLWEAAGKAIMDRPVTGYGIGNSVLALELFSPDIGGRSPHNTFLRMWVELGIFGLLIYLGFLFNILRGFIKSKQKSLLLVTVFAVLVGSFFQQIFESMLLAGLSIIGAYFLIFSALFESLVKLHKGKENSHNQRRTN